MVSVERERFKCVCKTFSIVAYWRPVVNAITQKGLTVNNTVCVGVAEIRFELVGEVGRGEGKISAADAVHSLNIPTRVKKSCDPLGRVCGGEGSRGDNTTRRLHEGPPL